MPITGSFWVFIDPQTGGWGQMGNGNPTNPSGEGSGCWKKVDCTEEQKCEDQSPPAVWKGTGKFTPTLSPAQNPLDGSVDRAIKNACMIKATTGVIPTVPNQIQSSRPEDRKICGYKGVCENGALNPPECNVCPDGYFLLNGRCTRSKATGGGVGGHHEASVNINGGSTSLVPRYP
jgi:hypothetical protein